MDSSPPEQDNIAQKEKEACESLVDPFLKEALRNPRHRLTILRMELDIQRFMQNDDQQQFEFQHFPTSYLRLAAHRVAQHYGLQSMVLDNIVDGLGIKIVVKKTSESRIPSIRLSEVPASQPENDKSEQVKIAIRPRPQNASGNDLNELGTKCCPLRTVEERKEEYDRARARIFSSSSFHDFEITSSQTAVDGKNACLSKDENAIDETEKTPSTRDVGTSRVAIFRDREKDRTDPDYDRSYERYVKSLLPNQSFNLGPFNMPNFQHSFLQYETGFSQPNQLPRAQTSFNYRASSTTTSPFCSVGSDHVFPDTFYMQWPNPSMMYAQLQEPFRHTVVQMPFYQQQPLSFDYTQNH